MPAGPFAYEHAETPTPTRGEATGACGPTTWLSAAVKVVPLMTALIAGAAMQAACARVREFVPPDAAWFAGAAVGVLIALGALVIVLVTERARRRLSRVERLATAGALAASLAHEIKNPMGIILSTTQVLARSRAVSPDDRRLLLEIEDEVRRADDQINAFLDLARDVPLKRGRCDLRDVARGAVDLLAAQARQARVDLVADLPEEPVAALGDRRRLRQALINLALNAIEACIGGGRVVVRVVADGIDDAIIAVEDDGPGIPPRLRKKVLEPFFTTKPSGTGLGLSIARRIVDRHGGKLSLSAREPRGTAVIITLKRKESGQSGIHQLRESTRRERCES